MENIPLVSIIIPVYNTERYLSDCITSVLSQKYTDFECILVDDGSTDRSCVLCDEFAAKDKRIQVIHKENGGLSEARNTGLYRARGSYVMFMDSDDFWSGGYVLSGLVSLFNGTMSYDFIQFNCCYYYTRKQKYKAWPQYPDSMNGCRSKNKKIIELISCGQFPMSACLKIIKKEFLIKNNIHFIRGIISEDVPWFLELLYKSNDFLFVNGYYYVYRKQVNNSISSSFSEKRYRDLYNIVVSETETIKNRCDDTELQNALLSFMAYEYCILMGMLRFFHPSRRREEMSKLKKYVWLFKYSLHPKVNAVKKVLGLAGFRITSCLLFLKLRLNS
ncbi:MAG: glycosyltransferase [Bacteroidales bacterium]|jgi:glycosyltransferase involved in cell wall biosynthesis|nr:glycosyltransferase [Bacteroidales bacterium]